MLNPVEDTFATRLKQLLLQKNLMLKQVAEALQVSSAAVHKWTRGGEIEYRKLRILADYLEVNWIWLRYGEQAVLDQTTAAMADPHLTELRRQHLAEIMESEARMKFAQEVSGIVSWEWNLLSSAVSYSSNAIQLFGRSINQLEDFWAAIFAEDVSALQQLGTQAITQAQPYEAEFRVLWPNGEWRWIGSRATPLLATQQRPIKMIGVSFDITQRRLAEQALRQHQAILAKAQMIARLGSWYWELDGDNCIWSDEAYRIFGWEAQAFKVDMDRYFAAIVPADRRRVDRQLKQAVQQQQAYSIRYRIRLADGSERLIHEEGEHWQDADQSTAAMIGVIQEVSEQAQPLGLRAAR